MVIKLPFYLILNDYFFDHAYDRYFDVHTFSCLEHLVKPYPEIYLRTLKKLKVLPQEAVFIDDRQINIDGAKNVGIDTILFFDQKQLVEDLKIWL